MAGGDGKARGWGYILANVKSAYDTAKNTDGKYHGWYLQQLKLTDKELEKGIRSFQKEIAKHQQWIDSPVTKNSDCYDLHPERQRHLIETKWPQDIQRHHDSIEILRGILRERRHDQP